MPTCEGGDQFSNVSDIDTAYILFPLVGGCLSVIMVVVLAMSRVLNQDKCSQAEEEKLKRDRDYLKEHSEVLKEQPRNLLERERAIANHILSIAESIQNG